MRRLTLLITLALVVAACGRDGDSSSDTTDAKKATSTTAKAASSDDTTSTLASGLVPSTDPTAPASAPAGAAPLDVTGAVWAIEPISGTIAVQTSASGDPSGVVLVLAKDASAKGVSSVNRLEIMQQVRIVGYSEQVGERRLFTATEVIAG